MEPHAANSNDLVSNGSVVELGGMNNRSVAAGATPATMTGRSSLDEYYQSEEGLDQVITKASTGIFIKD